MYLCKKCLEKFLSEGERDILITQSFAKNGKCDNCKKFEKKELILCMVLDK